MESVTASAERANGTVNSTRVAKPTAGKLNERVVFIVYSYAPISRRAQLETSDLGDEVLNLLEPPSLRPASCQRQPFFMVSDN
jgi:hypothetical protein